MNIQVFLFTLIEGHSPLRFESGLKLAISDWEAETSRPKAEFHRVGDRQRDLID
jgi:hypothetical protein